MRKKTWKSGSVGFVWSLGDQGEGRRGGLCAIRVLIFSISFPGEFDGLIKSDKTFEERENDRELSLELFSS